MTFDMYADQLGIDICKAVGLDPTHVSELTISIAPGRYPIAVVSVRLPGEVLPRFARYTLVPVDESTETPS